MESAGLEELYRLFSDCAVSLSTDGVSGSGGAVSAVPLLYCFPIYRWSQWVWRSCVSCSVTVLFPYLQMESVDLEELCRLFRYCTVSLSTDGVSGSGGAVSVVP